MNDLDARLDAVLAANLPLPLRRTIDDLLVSGADHAQVLEYTRRSCRQYSCDYGTVQGQLVLAAIEAYLRRSVGEVNLAAEADFF